MPELKQAIHKAIIYSPNFIIEKFIQNVSTYRVTVIDFDKIYYVKQVPANIVGDGTSTIRQLIDTKNSNPNRGGKDDKGFILQKIVEDLDYTDLIAGFIDRFNINTMYSKEFLSIHNKNLILTNG